MKEMLAIIWRAGKTPISLYLAFALCLVLIFANTLFPVAPAVLTDERIAKFAMAVALAFLAQLLWYEIERKDKEKGRHVQLSEAGIIGFHPRAAGPRFEELMSAPGKKVVLNTWIYNCESLIPLLETSLKHDKTEIELVILSPESKHVETRNEELPTTSVRNSIVGNREQLAFFLKSLPPDKQARVKVFEFDTPPRIVLHASDDEAFVGFFWPNQMAVHGPQLHVKGKVGRMAERVWHYYESLQKTEITENLTATAQEGNVSNG